MSLQNNWCVLNAIKNNIEHFSIFLLLISISKALVYELMKLKMQKVKLCPMGHGTGGLSAVIP